MDYPIFYASYDRVAKNQNFNKYIKILNFTWLLHQDKHSDFWNSKNKKERSKKISFLSEVIACSLCQFILHSVSGIKKKYLRLGIDCCRDIMFHMGYEESYLYSITDIGLFREKQVKRKNIENLNIILVLGCQSELLIKNRGIAAARLYSELLRLNNGSVKIVFSGLSTHPHKKQSIHNEYRRLQHYFLQEFTNIHSEFGNKKTLLKNFIYMETERKSHSTDMNVRKFISQILLKHRNTNINFFGVSSNFHLLRFAKAIQNNLNNKNNMNKIKANSIEIKKVALMGSEILDQHSHVVEDTDYFKTMFYDIYFYLFDNKIIKQ